MAPDVVEPDAAVLVSKRRKKPLHPPIVRTDRYRRTGPTKPVEFAAGTATVYATVKGTVRITPPVKTLRVARLQLQREAQPQLAPITVRLHFLDSKLRAPLGEAGRAKAAAGPLRVPQSSILSIRSDRLA